jgi:hypothetical protein
MNRTPSFRTASLILAAIAACLLDAATPSIASEQARPQSLQVYWYDSIGNQRSLSGVDWSEPDRMTRADIVNWQSTSAPWEPGAPSNYFAVRIVGTLRAHADGAYRFRLGSDDGSRLRIGGETIIDQNRLQGFRWEAREVYLTEGSKDLEVLFFENSGHAGLVLMWQKPSDPSPTVIPTEAFESPAGTAKPRITRWTEQPRLRGEREPLD